MLVWPGKNQRFMVGGACLRTIELHQAQPHAAQRGSGQQRSDIDRGVQAQHCGVAPIASFSKALPASHACGVRQPGTVDGVKLCMV